MLNAHQRVHKDLSILQHPSPPGAGAATPAIPVNCCLAMLSRHSQPIAKMRTSPKCPAGGKTKYAIWFHLRVRGT